MVDNNTVMVDIVQGLTAAGVECENVGGMFIGVSFDAPRRCGNHGHLLDGLMIELEGDSRAVTQPFFEGGAIGPDRVHESDNIGDVIVSFVKGVNSLPRLTD